MSGTPGGVIEKLGTHYLHRGILTTDQAKKIIIEATEKLLKEINQTEAIIPRLKNYPFLPSNIQITIFIEKKDGNDTYCPNLSVVTLDDGIFYFKANDPKNIFKSIRLFKESYEKAKEQYGNSSP